MPRPTFVDFRAVKAAITMEQVLDHYDLTPQFKRSGDSLSGPCPIHQGENPTQFRISLSKNIWNCFSQCKCGGNVLDFISRMENVSIHGAALNAIEWFHLDQAAMSASSDEKNGHDETKKERPAKSKPEPKRAKLKDEAKTPNVPLKFCLDKLDPTYPYLEDRGLTPETIAEFGLGFCAKGIMAERIAIPIHNHEGKIVAYAGRFPGESEEDTPKYKLPPGFRKGLEIFNLHRAIQKPDETPLVIVEGFFDCMRLHQLGYRKVVALMGSAMTAAQEELLREHVTPRCQIIVMLDENEAGQAGRDDIAVRLSKWCFVKVHVFDLPDSEPEQMTEEEVASIWD